MFGRTEVWSESDPHLHGRKKNTHESLLEQVHFTGYHIGDIRTIHSRAEWPRRASGTHACRQGTYYAHRRQLTTELSENCLQG